MERILQKLGRIQEYVQLVHSLQGECGQRFASDPIYRGAFSLSVGL